MEKRKTYHYTKFPAEVIRNARDSLLSLCIQDEGKSPLLSLRITASDGVSWNHDSEEEFFSDYATEHRYSVYSIIYLGRSLQIDFNKVSSADYTYEAYTEVAVSASNRHEIESIFNIFESIAAACKLPLIPRRETNEPPPPLKIFIGQETFGEVLATLRREFGR